MRDKEMDALKSRHLACPVLPKTKFEQVETGGLFTTGALEVIFKYLMII